MSRLHINAVAAINAVNLSLTSYNRRLGKPHIVSTEPIGSLAISKVWISFPQNPDCRISRGVLKISPPSVISLRFQSLITEAASSAQAHFVVTKNFITLVTGRAFAHVITQNTKGAIRIIA